MTEGLADPLGTGLMVELGAGDSVAGDAEGATVVDVGDAAGAGLALGVAAAEGALDGVADASGEEVAVVAPVSSMAR